MRKRKRKRKRDSFIACDLEQRFPSPERIGREGGSFLCHLLETSDSAGTTMPLEGQ
jgi:hypothetical protein